VNNCRWSGVRIEQWAGLPKNPGSVGILLDNCDNFRMDSLNIVAFGYGVKTGDGFVTGLYATKVEMSSCDVGAWLKCSPMNWHGGKIQQGKIGMYIQSTGFNVTGVELAIQSDCAAELELCSVGNFHCYSEKIGPRDELNDEQCVLRFKQCNSINVQAAWLNCAFGAPWGARLFDCQGINFNACRASHFDEDGGFLWANDELNEDIFIDEACSVSGGSVPDWKTHVFDPAQAVVNRSRKVL